MSASIYTSRHDKSAPAPIGPDLEDRSQVRSQLGIVREMLENIEVLTTPGQRHTMEKVVAFLQLKIGEGAFSVSLRNRRALSQSVERLAREAQRPVPDIRRFCDRAKPVVALLLATT